MVYINLINNKRGIIHKTTKSEVNVMKQVIVNGVSYLGDLEIGENGVTVKNAIKVGDVVTRADVTRYFQEANVGNLEDVVFGGNGVAYSIMELSDDNKNYIKIAELVMDQAKSVAVRKLENQEFLGELGKLTGDNGVDTCRPRQDAWEV